jgi:hypothetical protein
VFHHYDSVRFIADAAYDLPHVPLFNSRTLHDYFRKHKIGVFKRTAEDQLFFEHVISTPVYASINNSSRSTSKRRLLFYARPEAHAGRNLFEIGILALRECAIRGVIGLDWELVGIGSAVAYDVEIVEGVIMSILPRVPQADYEQFLVNFDLGLSLMSSPHPGVVHFEWAAAGIPTIVNTTPERGREYFERFGGNLISAEPSVSGIADAIERAVKNLTRERSKPTINLSSFSGSWDEAFSKPLITEVIRRMSIPTEKR